MHNSFQAAVMIKLKERLCTIFFWLFWERLKKMQKATVSFIMSVSMQSHCPAWNSSVPTGRIFL